MQLPETSDLLLPMLEILSNGEECHLQELAIKLAQVFEFSQSGEIKDRTLDAQFYSRVVGTRSYLTHACLIESPKRGVSKISKRGLELLEQKPESLTMKSLTRYPEFLNYLKTSTSENLADFITPENKNEFAEMNQKNKSSKKNGTSHNTKANGGNGNTSASAAKEKKAAVVEPVVEAKPEPIAEVDPDPIISLIEPAPVVEEEVAETETINAAVEAVVNPEPEPILEVEPEVSLIAAVEEPITETIEDNFQINQSESVSQVSAADVEPIIEEPPVQEVQEIVADPIIAIDEHLTPPANLPAIDIQEVLEPEKLGISDLLVNTPVVDFLDDNVSPTNTDTSTHENFEAPTPEVQAAVESRRAESVVEVSEDRLMNNDIHSDNKPKSKWEHDAEVAQTVAPANNATPHMESNTTTATVGSRNTVMVSQENFASSLELIEQLRLASQLGQLGQSLPTQSSTPQVRELEKLNPARYTMLALMRFLENWFQHFWLYLIPFVLMGLAYVASLFILADEFVSKGVLFVQTDTLINQVQSLGDDNVDFFLSPSQQTADEINELLNTDSFIRLIITQTPLEAEMAKGDKIVRETIVDVRESIAINITGSNNVEVLSSWDDQQIAWKTATATMNSYIEWKINSDKRDIFGAREFLEQLVPQYENEYLGSVQSLEEYLIQHPEPFRGDRPEIEQLQIDQLQVASQTSFERYQAASDNLEQIRLEEVIIEGKTRQSYTIVDSPKIPVDEEGGLVRKVVTAAVFLTLGVVLSMLAIIASTLLDRSIRFPLETTSTLGLPVLSGVNMVKNFDELSSNVRETQE